MSHTADFALGPDYAALVDDFRAKRRAARDVANACLEREETYHAYVFLLLAADAGDDDAVEEMDMLREVDQVCDEDVHLAELQVALWYQHGHLVPRDPALAAAHLPMAALPFLTLPSNEEISAAADVLAFRDRAWDAALVAYGIPKSTPPVDPVVVDRVLAQIFSDAGWPPTIDIALPLGPSMPYRPHYIHHRHAIPDRE